MKHIYQLEILESNRHMTHPFYYKLCNILKDGKRIYQFYTKNAINETVFYYFTFKDKDYAILNIGSSFDIICLENSEIIYTKNNIVLNQVYIPFRGKFYAEGEDCNSYYYMFSKVDDGYYDYEHCDFGFISYEVDNPTILKLAFIDFNKILDKEISIDFDRFKAVDLHPEWNLDDCILIDDDNFLDNDEGKKYNYEISSLKRFYF